MGRTLGWAAWLALTVASTAGSQVPQTSGLLDRPIDDPWSCQVLAQIKSLADPAELTRARAAEALAVLRADAAEPALLQLLNDPSPRVRRAVALALGRCGSRWSVEPLIGALEDADPLTALGAAVALTNLTGMQFPFDPDADIATRREQVRQWARWSSTIRPGTIPESILELLRTPNNLALGCSVTTSTTYRGPAAVLTDGSRGPAYWQTKNVPCPQYCQVDLGRTVQVDTVRVHQYGTRFVMTDYRIESSVDGRQYELLEQHTGLSPVTIEAEFTQRPARYIRITSEASCNATYPTTFYEVEVLRRGPREERQTGSTEWSTERGLRALGALRGRGADEAILKLLNQLGPARMATDPKWRPVIRAGIRALGRQRESESAFQALAQWMNDTELARFAADALGDYGDPRAVPILLAAYPKFARGLKDQSPSQLPPDDRMTFPSEDRMFETPFAIASALCRLPAGSAENHETLKQLAGLLVANLPGDHDSAVIYQLESGHQLTACLLERAGMRQEACEQAFVALGQTRRVPQPNAAPPFPVYEPYRMAGWLPRLCRDPHDTARLIRLLDHGDYWVRLNAAKALGFLPPSEESIRALDQCLEKAPSECSYGYSPVFKDEEFNDPSPRYREAVIRALGQLGSVRSVPSMISVLNDPGSVLEVRHAAAQALSDLRTPDALQALRRAAANHPIYSVRQVAQEAVWKATSTSDGNSLTTSSHDRPVGPSSMPVPKREMKATSETPKLQPEAIVFIKGENKIPNTEGTVEQADRWYQTYVVTDSGPAYRPGRNLYKLSPARADGQVTRLTNFSDGYVADLEVSWDGRRVIFSRRGQSDPWWHVFEMNSDGTGLRQLTDGPYHDVGPAYLPGGQIVFSSSRLGIRDEYHGYPCTGLHVMEADGGGIHPISTNIGRDNEPAILPDGRIVFSRLEVFYARLKTELTLHAMHPDGTRDVVLYGPERRQFWRSRDVGPRSPAHGQEAPLTHRVLRMTQPQPMPDGQGIIVVTQGGLAIVGQQRNRETIIPHDKMWAYTTPFPMPDGAIVCAATEKKTEKKDVDVGLYLVDAETGTRSLLYNDPQSADFEPRPLLRRELPRSISDQVDRSSFSGNLLCQSAFSTQESQVMERGRLVRVVEGLPVVSRHSTQTDPWPVWKNHHGTLARVLGTVPLASDGSFYLQVPADRLLHLQVLDSDGRVVGNQLTWINARPGATRSCVGCHESPHSTPSRPSPLLALQRPPVPCLPDGQLFLYRAKAWFKGRLPDPIEERTRTVRAVNLLAR